MTSEIRKSSNNLNNYIRLSRQVRRLPADEFRIILALPDEIPETCWVDILNNEETELMILSIREDIIDLAMDVCYENYMERQKFAFTVYCAADAWLQIIDWHYFRHDPGEEPSAYPPADIPNRQESWIPDEIPDPSPKDTWCRHDLEVVEEEEEEETTWSSSSLTPVVEEVQVERIDVEEVVCEEMCPCSIETESTSCDGPCTGQPADSRPAASSSISNHTNVKKVDSSPLVPVSSECGDGDCSSRSSKPRKPKNIFSQSTSGRSKQSLPPLPPMEGKTKRRSN